MIFRRALMQELASYGSAIFVGLMTLTVTILLVRLLGRITTEQLLPTVVLPMLGFAVLQYLPTVLSLSVLLSVMITLNRAYRDSEMAVWFSSGLSLLFWVRPILVFTVPLAIVVGSLSLYLSPWAYSQSQRYLAEVKRTGELNNLEAGVFRELREGRFVFFVDAIYPGSDWAHHVFAMNEDAEGNRMLLTGDSARVRTTSTGEKDLLVEQGQRLEILADQRGFRVIDFDRQSMALSAPERVARPEALRMQSTLALMEHGGAEALAELFGRISAPVLCLLLALLGVVLADSTPRRSVRSWGIAIGVLIFATQSNVVSFLQSWIQDGRIHFVTALWAVYLPLSLLVIGLFAMRLGQFRRLGL